MMTTLLPFCSRARSRVFGSRCTGKVAVMARSLKRHLSDELRRVEREKGIGDAYGKSRPAPCLYWKRLCGRKLGQSLPKLSDHVVRRRCGKPSGSTRSRRRRR
eukprot:37397-Pyramimonas_sp.AAC.1